MYTLPVTNQPNQTFTTQIPVDGENRNFKFFFSWNTCENHWQMTLTDNSTDEILLSNYPLFLRSFPYNNIISHLSYKKIGSLYIVNLSGNNQETLNLDNLGLSFILVWGDTPDA